MKSFFVLAATLFSVMPALSQSNGVADRIRALDKAERDAAVRGDTALEEKYTAANCVSINPGGGVSPCEQNLAAMKSGDLKLDTFDVDQEEVEVHGDTAVVTGRNHVRGSFKGHAFDSWARHSRVWVKENGAWKLVLFQETPIAQAGQ
jgi:ketosteroid isomerase-like protein